MTERNSRSGTPLTQNKSTEQKTTTAQIPPKPSVSFTEFCDDLNDLRAMNYFIYDAVEALDEEPNESTYHEQRHMGLMLVLRYLRAQDQALMEKLSRMEKPT
jgi:hypothetical protein